MEFERFFYHNLKFFLVLKGAVSQDYLAFFYLNSVADPKLFTPDPDPDPALNFPSSGSGSRQKFRIHADPDPTYIN